MASTIAVTPPTGQFVSAEDALKVARLDAEKVYRDLSAYRIALSLERDGWHIDYDFKTPGIQGGGPHYLIDAVTGVILTKRYDQ
jgi:hypothetical protein